MRAAIFGAGAMGTVLGAHIARAGRQIDLITRNASHVNALNGRGAKIGGTVDFTVPVTALTPDEMSGEYDIIFLMTKQRENVKICEFLLKYLKSDGAICTMQNGLPEPSVASVVGDERTLGCAVSWGATFIGEGCALLTSSPEKLTFSLGSHNSKNPNLAKAAELLSCMGKVTIENNFIGARWAKLAINSAFSSLSAITGLTFGEVAANKCAKKIALAMLNEAFSVAKSCGVKIQKIQGHDIVIIYRCKGGVKKLIALKLLPFAMKSHKNIVSGMYYDLKAGKKCDIEFINGVIYENAKKCGVPAPFNEKVLEIVKKIESKELEISTDNLLLLSF